MTTRVRTAVEMPPTEVERPWYRQTGNESAVFRLAFQQRLPLMLKGPTGCGKTRFVEAMAVELDRPLVTVACHEETSAVDLLGRYLLEGGETRWQDGPLTRAVRQGAILYLDEVAEAREDVIVVLHPLADHRRELYLDRHDESLQAPDEFMLVVSFNPGYRRGLRELKPSTRQRFVSVSMDYPAAPIETDIVAHEGDIDVQTAKRLVAFGRKVRTLDELGLAETVSTRLLVSAASLIKAGLAPREACAVAIVEPLTDDSDVSEALREVAALVF